MMNDLWLPPKKQEPDTRNWGPLELRDKAARAQVHKAFTDMLNAIPMAGCMATSHKSLCEHQRDSVEFIARQLLGDDFTWEELT